MGAVLGVITLFDYWFAGVVIEKVKTGWDTQFEKHGILFTKSFYAATHFTDVIKDLYSAGQRTTFMLR